MKKHMGSFWLDEDSVSKMKLDNWRVFILRTDSWTIVADPEKVTEALKPGELWVGSDSGIHEELDKLEI